MSNSAKLFSSFVFALVTFLPIHSLLAEQPAGPEKTFPVFEADMFTIKEAGNIFSYEGNVRMTYGDTSLTADKVSYWKKEGIVEAEGTILFRRGKQFISGEGMRYDVNTGEGVTRFAASAMYPWYGWGETITRVSPGVYKVENGYVTTCDYLKPHWRIQAKEILLHVDEKVVARKAAVYIGKIPILYVPKYSHRLDDTRFPFTISPGHNSDWGAYLLTAYNTIIKGVKTTFHLDYRQKNGVAGGVDAAFQTKGGKGLLETYYANDDHRELPDGKVVHDQRYRIHYGQVQDLGNNTVATVEINKLSDAEFLDEFFRDRFEDELQPRSFVNITRYDPRYTLSLFVRKRLNDFFNVTERLPEVSMDIRNQRIAGTPIYYRGINSFVNLRQEFADDAEPSYDTIRFDTFHQFSYPRKYFGWLVAVPRIWFRGTYFSEGVEDDDLFRGAAGTEMELFTKIFRTWDVQNPKLGIDALRHVVEPSITYAYAPDPTVEPEELLHFDPVDEVDYMNQFRLGVRNKLQTKRRQRTWDLIDFDFYTYYFPKESPEGNSFSDLFLDMEIWPSNNLKFETDARIDPYDGTLDEFNTQFTVFNTDKWAANIEYRHRLEESDLLASEFYYRINSNWAIKVYERYEFETNELEEVEVALYRDLHDWQSAFSFRHREDENQFWVVFYLKPYPEMPIASGH
ncbi:MAG: LPS assembly protein LptD [bacterium]|nr:LPS assembly protein LptD [bacterium]